MKANPDDQLGRRNSAKRFPMVAVQVAVALVILVVLIWFWFDQEPAGEIDGAGTIQSEVVHPESSNAKPAPDIPLRPAAKPVIAPSEIDEDPNGLAATPDGDTQLRETFELAGADARLLGFLGDQRPLEISAALIDGTSWGAMLRKILPADAPKQAFGVDTRGDELFISASSYARYNVYADSIESLNTDILVQGFHRLRPLYESAYQALGLDPEDFDNAVIRTLARVLSTPELAGPVALEHNSVLYQFADPKLESLSDLHKQMLRMGPDNVRRIKLKAQALRDGLLEN